MSEGICRASELRDPPEFDGQYDPHVWFDVALWARCVERRSSDELAAPRPGPRCDLPRQSAGATAAELAELDAWVQARIATIPLEQRVLITAHDAFGYFGRAYGFEVAACRGSAPPPRRALRDVDRARRPDRRQAQIPAIFVESSVPRRGPSRRCETAVRVARLRRRDRRPALLRRHGRSRTPEGTYVGMVRAQRRRRSCARWAERCERPGRRRTSRPASAGRRSSRPDRRLPRRSRCSGTSTSTCPTGNADRRSSGRTAPARPR